MRPKTAMIFCAGFGTRMGELTKDVPKPLLPVGGVPLFDRVLDLASAAGVDDFVANTHYLADIMEAHARRLGVRVSQELPDILDTGGGLKQALPLLGDNPIFTANPDVVWDGPNPFDILASAWNNEMAALLLCVPVDRAMGRTAGDFTVHSPGFLQRPGHLVYGGMQIVRPGVVKDVPHRVFSLNSIWNDLSDQGRAHVVEYPGYWCDVGSPEGIRRAEDMLNTKRHA